MGYLSESILVDLSEILENAESFEVYFQDTKRHKNIFDFNSKYIDFQANQVAKNISDELRKDLISGFLKDVEKGGKGSRCWIPHHGIRAFYKNQLIEIAVCFMCSWFRGEMLEERFYGTFPEEEKSESKLLFDKIIAELDL